MEAALPISERHRRKKGRRPPNEAISSPVAHAPPLVPVLHHHQHVANRPVRPSPRLSPARTLAWPSPSPSRTAAVLAIAITRQGRPGLTLRSRHQGLNHPDNDLCPFTLEAMLSTVNDGPKKIKEEPRSAHYKNVADV